MDRNYRKEATAYKQEHGLPEDTELKQQAYPDFPLERARLTNTWWLLGLFSASTAVYGFSAEWHIAIPLTMQFIGESRSSEMVPFDLTMPSSCLYGDGYFQHQLDTND